MSPCKIDIGVVHQSPHSAQWQILVGGVGCAVHTLPHPPIFVGGGRWGEYGVYVLFAWWYQAITGTNVDLSVSAR